MQLKCLNILFKIYNNNQKKEVIILEINKIIKLKINNENLKELEKLLAIWR
jgi:ribosomal protein L28